jgi:hypothetical protein
MKKFGRLQPRQAKTEARIGILKHGFPGRPMRSKGFAHRELALAYSLRRGRAKTPLPRKGYFGARL